MRKTRFVLNVLACAEHLAADIAWTDIERVQSLNAEVGHHLRTAKVECRFAQIFDDFAYAVCIDKTASVAAFCVLVRQNQGVGEVGVGFCKCFEFAVKDCRLFVSCAVEKMHFTIQTSLQNLANHRHKRGDTRTACEENRAFGVENGVEAEHAGRSVGLQSVAYFRTVEEVVGHKAALDASNGDFIVCSLTRRGANRVGTSGSHAVDFDCYVDILTGLKRGEISVFADETNGFCVFCGRDYLGDSQIQNRRVKLIDNPLRSCFVKRKVFADFFGNGNFVEDVFAVFHCADESFFYCFHITSSPSKFCLRFCCRTYSSDRNRRYSPSPTQSKGCR